jgi:hypothetical protein
MFMALQQQFFGIDVTRPAQYAAQKEPEAYELLQLQLN